MTAPTATSAPTRRDTTGLPSPATTGVEALTPAQVEALAAELDALRNEVLADRGAKDMQYIRTVIAVQRGLEAGGRAALAVSLLPPAWVGGTAMLATAKILATMELGHNVLHGQWDWMGDPAIHSTTWDWDFLPPVELWKDAHNHRHHTWANVVGRDRDFGYALLRMSPRQPWHPGHLAQPLINAALAPLFEPGIALYDLAFDEVVRGRKSPRRLLRDLRALAGKSVRQLAKDYLFFPALAGPSALPCLLGNLTANTVRSLWLHVLLECGHFPQDVRDFSEEEVAEETKGQWYVRQIQGAANVDGGPLFHLLSGNTGLQIEHHLFPDLPSNRYGQIAPRVRDICRRYGIPYVTGSLPRQYVSCWARILRYSLPLR